ncbi:5-bromo-4-chloroindolyl phosphate hydrolysis family protein [Marinovum sp. 2_MG-2023]|uniref:5-bromo-4-chloroindolyl phosphate hydrolysis family protein n=1 Tax=Roseobacteraceae TaxID=2854170 RepID=UPI001FD13B2D|nr:MULTISPECIES: 5-bromo-4-chloroindolyl phosphate hydrolysis family protein [Roseobacteraceae]MCJ7873136.1 5-bromo-4-chloroindolyl phosphate hydrolysis family protein [Phaeobacter sp. J2-8]MDO6730745.1 5-bromo-4-chloroindolyl phosphate hydrolysis family protein [Marinovum sp. 2_MG-2023]MDO6780050.1 5-bromo-4-chloroindolyl phosphate hydrolysis family protein [Marinovum sp. 1_MG-2023]
MAQRFGGTFSPAGKNDRDYDARPLKVTVSPTGARSNLLFVPGVILAFMSFGSGPESLALGLAGAGTWTLAAWLTREGLKAESAYHSRKVARRPALPRKIIGSLLIGGGTVLAGLSQDTGLAAAALYGVIGAALHMTAFGPDPLRNKSLEGVDEFQQDRVARVIDEAEAHLDAMKSAIRRAQDPRMEARVERFQQSVREMLRTVEEDPRDLTASRKFLGVYLMGARDATIKFADIYARNRDSAAKSDYLMLLTDLEENYIAKTRKLLEDSNSDLTVEIDVLRDRLQREGVRLD